MNWITHFDDDNFKVESSAIDELLDFSVFYTWGRSMIRVTFKNVTSCSEIDVNGTKYKAYINDETIIVEITDYVRFLGNGSNDAIVFRTVPGNDLIYQLPFITVYGERPTFINTEKLPSEIPFHSVPPGTGRIFYFQTTESMERLDYGDWVQFTDDGVTECTTDTIDELLIRTVNGHNYTRFVEMECLTDKLLIQWVGHFGVRKSWYFTVERYINGSDKQLSLQVIDNGFNTLKNKRSSVQLVHRKADRATQHYLSDLCLSDEVIMYVEKLPYQVKIDNNSMDVTNKKRDVQVLVNLFAYDTI